ncbi:MAG: sugar kinase [Oscillospiraceae bacterium]|jgi:2-dehydro-3-deoxygluconokinase|nr:sugar kinase [Oscillospiraceae bacterium]
MAPRGYLKFIQADGFDINYTGSEANVCVSLCSFGLAADFVTKLPKNDISAACLATMRKFGVGVDKIVYGGDRLGSYYLERGASQRPSKVIYDRKYSSISMAGPADFDWDTIFADAGWFHFTGINPALGGEMARISLDACKAARQSGLTVSCDLNYRKNLWSTEEAREIMPELVRRCDLLIGNEEDAEKCLGLSPEGTDVVAGRLNREGYAKLAATISERFEIPQVAFTLRTSRSASDNNWAGMLYSGGNAYFSKAYDIHMVDRVGGGDSFSAGLIYALVQGYDPQEAIEFAVAASCLKQTMEYDFNLATAEDVRQLMGGDGSGRVQR